MSCPVACSYPPSKSPKLSSIRVGKASFAASRKSSSLRLSPCNLRSSSMDFSHGKQQGNNYAQVLNSSLDLRNYYGRYRVDQTYKMITYSSSMSKMKMREVGNQESKKDEGVNQTNNDIPFIDFLGVGISS